MVSNVGLEKGPSTIHKGTLKSLCQYRWRGILVFTNILVLVALMHKFM